jgi:hypothetical protein
LHKAVTEAKEEQIKVNLYEPLLENYNNHQKEVEAIKALLKLDARTVE